MDRIAGFTEILALDPGNVLARYGLAMEHVNQGDLSAALTEFDTLLKANPDYTAGWFMSAQALAKHNRIPEAIERLQRGIASATRTGNTHARGEMQGMLDELSGS